MSTVTQQQQQQQQQRITTLLSHLLTDNNHGNQRSLTTQTCDASESSSPSSKVSVGDALAAKNRDDAQRDIKLKGKSTNSEEIHVEQARGDLSQLRIPDAVKVLDGGNRSSLSLEEWKSKKGKEVGVSNWFPLDQQRVDAFAVVTGDPQFIHTRHAADLGSPFGQPIVHGFMLVSMLPYLSAQAIPGVKGVKMAVNYGSDKIRFVSPVIVGSRVRLRVKLHDVTDIQSPGAGKGIQNITHCTLEVEGGKPGKPAVTIQQISRYYF